MNTELKQEESFLKGLAFLCSAERIAQFKRLKKKFNCSLCGHEFKIGDGARWIYANGTPGAGTGNFFVCSACDLGLDSEIIQRAKESLANAVKQAKQWGIYGPEWECR